LRPVALLAVIALALGAPRSFAQAADAPVQTDAGTVDLAPVAPHVAPVHLATPIEPAKPKHWYWGWLIAGAGAAATVGVGAGAASCGSSSCSRNMLALLTTFIAAELIGGGYAVVAALGDAPAAGR
jgi:hypothetical protein